MKNSQQILSSLQNRSQFKKLSNVFCIKKIQTLFPQPLQQMIVYGYIQNKTLYFVLSHPWAKQEFHHIIQSIKTPLKQFTPKECENIEITDIKAYVSHKPRQEIDLYTGASSDEEFAQRAQAQFINDTTDEQLHAIFEDIRDILSKKNDK